MKIYDYNKLKAVIDTEKRKLSRDKVNAKNCDDCLLEVTVLLKKFFDFLDTNKAELIANQLISLDYWMERREVETYKISNIKIGEVYMADLGLGYDKEAGFYHPVMILDKIGAVIIVIPISSSTNQVNNAINGNNKYLCLIEEKDFENLSNKLDSTSVAILSNIRAIGTNRLLSLIGKINNKKAIKIKEETSRIIFEKIIKDYEKQIFDLKQTFNLTCEIGNDYY